MVETIQDFSIDVDAITTQFQAKIYYYYYYFFVVAVVKSTLLNGMLHSKKIIWIEGIGSRSGYALCAQRFFFI